MGLQGAPLLPALGMPGRLPLQGHVLTTRGLMPTVFIPELSWVLGRLSPETEGMAQRGPPDPAGTERDRAQASTLCRAPCSSSWLLQRGHWSLWILFWRFLTHLWADLLGVASRAHVAVLSLLRGPAQPPGCQRLKEQEGTAEMSLATLFSYRLGNQGPCYVTCSGFNSELVRAQKDLGKGGQTDGHLISGLRLLGSGGHVDARCLRNGAGPCSSSQETSLRARGCGLRGTGTGSSQTADLRVCKVRNPLFRKE